MARIEGKCIGDCSRCELLASGEVDMIPCILDQIFARVRRQDSEIADMKRMMKERGKPAEVQLAGIDDADMVQLEEEEA